MDGMEGWKPITSSHTSNGCLQSIVTHVETVFCHRSNLGLCRHCLSTRLSDNWRVVTGLQITDSWGGLMPSDQLSWQASSGLLPPSRAALSHSIHATCGHAVRLPAAIASFHQRAHCTASINAQTGSSRLQVDRGGGRDVMFTLNSSSPWRTSTLQQQPSNPPCMGRYLLHSCTCTVLFAVPDFPGNLAVFIPRKSGMKKSGNPGRPGNGSPGMNSLDCQCVTDRWTTWS